MSASLTEKWKAVRELRERWSAPLNLLDQIMGRMPGTCARKAKSEEWIVQAHLLPEAEGGFGQGDTSLSRVLLAQAVKVFQHQLFRFEADDQSPDAEKRARAFSILAKTLESLVALGMKMESHALQFSDPERGRSGVSDPGSQTGEAEELDQQLAALIGNLIQDGENPNPAGFDDKSVEGASAKDVASLGA